MAMDIVSAAQIGTAAATLALVGVGCLQIRALRQDNRVDRTLVACARYESDATIEQCVRTLRAARDDDSYNQAPKRFQHEVVIVLNYLDSIAIGVKQGLYESAVVEDHLK